jgi:hypothetical protein
MALVSPTPRKISPPEIPPRLLFFVLRMSGGCLDGLAATGTARVGVGRLECGSIERVERVN